MSAGFNKKDDFGWLVNSLLPSDIGPKQEQFITTTFEAQSDYDVKDLTEKMKQEATLRQVAKYKTLLAPLELILTRLIFGKDTYKAKLKLCKVYYLFHRKKIKVQTFQKRLLAVMESERVI